MITRDQAKRVQEKIDAALKQIAADEGLSFGRGSRCTYGLDAITLKAELKEVGDATKTGVDQTATLLRFCKMDGIDPAASYDGHVLVDYNVRAHSTPYISAKGSKRYRWSTERVRAFFKARVSSAPDKMSSMYRTG